MVMTRYGEFGRKRLVKGSSNSKGKTFDQEGLVMDLIDVDPLSSAPPTALVPYGTFEDDAPSPITLEKLPPSPIKDSLSDQGPNLERNLVQTSIETNVSDIETEKTKEDEPNSYQLVRRNSIVSKS